MIRAESQAETRGESAAEKGNDRDVDHTAEGEAKPVDKPAGDQAVESGLKAMHPDSGKYTPSPPTGPPAAGAITCPECGMENVASPGRRFCGDCGASLWESCQGCGADVPVDERFCGQCGLDMAESARQQISNAQQHLSKASRLEQEYRFSDAKTLLSSVAGSTHPRLKRHAEKAQQRLEHLRREHERWEHLADAADTKAREALARCEFDETIHALESIPDPLRSTAMQTLLQDTKLRRNEVAELDAQLRTLLAEKRAAELFPVLERLQRLHPNHGLASKVATRMHDQLVAKAEAKMAARQYDAALERLGKIPTSAQTPHAEQLHREAEEMSALFWHAQHSQHVDGALREVLMRLVQRLPKDETVRKLVAEFKKRQQLVEAPDQTEPVAWAGAAKSPWECPIRWATSPERIDMSEVSASVRRRFPGAFAVAFGLALQGIDQGPVKIDFSDSSSGVMGRVARMMREKRHGSAWGIDIGDHALKAVKLLAAEGGKQIEAAVCEAIPHRKLLSQAADYGEARDIAEESFEQLRGRHSLKGGRLCVAMPGRLTICRTIQLPPSKEKKAEEALRFEARRVLPGNLAEYRWQRYCPDLNGAGDRPRTDVLLLALTQRHMRQVDEMLQRLNLQPDILQTEFLALHNFLGFELSTEGHNGDGRQKATAFLDVGACGANMIVHSSHYLWAKYLGVGGHSFSRALLREFQLTLHQAEDWKRDPSRVDRWSRWEAALGSVFAAFSTEFSSALKAFEKDHPGQQIEQILVAGGGIRTYGFLRYLRTGR